MPKCKGKTVEGKKCRAHITRDGYCRWHAPKSNNDPPDECVVCYEPFEELQRPLDCGHWIHKTCIQKSGDAMQDTRAQDGYPPIYVCICPVCRAPVPGVIPKDPPPVPPLPTQILVSLDYEEMSLPFGEWLESDRIVPLEWYIWIELCMKYPEYHPDDLVIASTILEEMVNPLVIPNDAHVS